MAAITYAARSFTIAPGGTVEVVRDSGFVACLSASAAFKIRFDDGSENDFQAGLTYRPQGGFQRVAIRNTGAAQLTVALGFGKGEITDSRVSLNPDVTLPVRPARPDVLTSGAPVSALNVAATLLAAANALRREIIVVAPVGAGTVYVGGNSGAAAGEGLPLLAGQAITLETTAAVYARNDTGAAVALAVAELEWTA